MDRLCKKSASELAELVRSKEASSKEIVEAHFNRIKEVNPDINAITLTLEESALKLADEADSAGEEERNRPFHGVPFTIKENIDFMGTPTTNGIPLLAESMHQEMPP